MSKERLVNAVRTAYFTLRPNAELRYLEQTARSKYRSEAIQGLHGLAEQEKEAKRISRETRMEMLKRGLLPTEYELILEELLEKREAGGNLESNQE